MIDPLSIVVFGSAGVVLGAAFYGGLWTTVKRLHQARRAAIWVLGSLTLRFGVVLVGFYLIARYRGWEALVSATVGFTLSRIVVVHRLRPNPVAPTLPEKESES